ncbi:MAG: polysaccharide pyruvyl transferase family protein [Bacteroidales bacterium]|nr:polysaccharide pyruvyl transferase family protein [Bacteroidales bacterium]
MNSRKIRLFTWYRGANYGSSLQAYALLHKLALLGYKVKVIREFNYPYSLNSILNNIWLKLGFSVSIFRGLKIKRIRALKDYPYPVARKRFLSFFRKEIPSVLPAGPLSLGCMKRNTRVFVTGSDQLWNCYDHFRGLEFLDFVHGVKKVSYATSIGAGSIPEQYQDQVRSYLSEYSHISVREKSAELELKRITGRSDIRTVLDPTFLLSAEEWRSLAGGASNDLQMPGRYIFCYLLRKDFDYSETLARIKEQTGIQEAVLFPSNENPGLQIEGCRRCGNAGPKEFVKALDGAAFVLTDSFHGSALSIILGKQFANLKRFSDNDVKSQNSRLYNLMDMLGMQPRFVEDGFPQAIDYAVVQAKLAALREDSVSYLKEIVE